MMDISDNAQVFDEFINLGEDGETTDRFGQTLHSARKQIKTIAADAVANIKWQQLGEWAAGVILTNAAQIIRYDGDWYRYKGTFDHTTSGDSPGDDGGVWSLTNTDGLWINIGDAALRQEISSTDGYKHVGQCTDYATLKLITPEEEGQRVLLKEYTAGTGHGGGEFKAVAGTATEDNGIHCVVSDSWYWQRIGDPMRFDVTAFGAVPDGVTDCATAVSYMAAWSFAQSSQTNTQFTRIGVKFPAGNFAISSWAYTDYVSYFRMSGALAAFGYFAGTKLILIGDANSWAITVQARWCEFTGIDVYGQYDKDSVVRHFFKNTVVGGAYFHAHLWHATYMGGKCFFLYDTLDTKFSEFYTNYTYDNVICAIMSGTSSGSWDHTTAIELCNFNIQYHSGTSADACALYLPRSTQSLISNGWIEHSTYPGNISEGQWKIDCLSLESNSYPLYAQYARIVETGTNVNGSNGFDYDNGAVGALNGVAQPSWAVSAYEMGRAKLMSHGFEMRGSLAYQYRNSMYRLTNMSGSTNWFNVGTFVLPTTGASCQIRLVGTRGFDSASASPNMIGTTYGGGEATILIQDKNDTTKSSVTWYGEEATPITKVKYVQVSKNTVTIYVLMGAYTYAAGVMVDTDSTSRFQAGQHFYWTPSLAVVSDITAVDSIQDAISTKSFNNGTYGFGMELDTGILSVTSSLVYAGGQNYLQIKNNGTLYYLPLFTTSGSLGLPIYAKADLPAASGRKGHEVFVTDTAKTPALQKVQSDGTNWVYAIDPTTTVS